MPRIVVTAAQVEAVWGAWRLLRPRPAQHRLTVDVQRTIAGALRLGYTADELILVCRYLHQADTVDARWMQGKDRQNTREYLQLDNILRHAKLAGRVTAALDWSSRGAGQAGSVSADVTPYRLVGPEWFAAGCPVSSAADPPATVVSAPQPPEHEASLLSQKPVVGGAYSVRSGGFKVRG